MPRSVRCPDCRRSFPLADEDADRRRVPCPDCGELVLVPRSDDDRPRPRRRSGRRWLVGGLVAAGVLGVGCCGGLMLFGWFAVRPTSFPEQTQDYADARKAHRTVLVKSGPAPQPWDDEPPPAGAKVVTYTSGQLKLTAWVGPPAAGPPRPAVLFLHGGFAFGADDWDQAKPFRDAGYVVMIPMLRGENGLPGAYSMFFDEVDDVLAAADALARTPGVDPNRLYVAGHSVGGTMAMLAAMAKPRFRAAASLSGSPDQVAWARGQEEVVPFDPADKREFAIRSPLAFPKSFKCPARVYYGSEEVFFQFSSAALAKKATAAGLDVQAVEVPGDHLTMVGPALRECITFFKQH